MNIKEEIRQLKREIAEYNKVLDEKTSRLLELEVKMADSIDEVKKKDKYIGKYYKRVTDRTILYHPQEYGSHYCAFDWRSHIVYEGLYCTYRDCGTEGTEFKFGLQAPIAQDYLVNDFVEITKEEFEEELKTLMNDVMDIFKTDTFYPNDKKARIYETVKAKNKWL